MKQVAVLALALTAASPAAANDSIAELRTGGLAFVRSETIAMQSEDLFVSMDEIRVRYTFRNDGPAEEKVLVAFPMPDIEGNPWEGKAIPDADAENFLDFRVTIDGAPVTPSLQKRAFAAGLDRTDVLEKAGIPLEPMRQATFEAVEKLPLETRRDWVRLGLLVVDQYDTDGKGMVDHYQPYWTLKATYYWDAVFPPGRPVTVEHTYKPSVGMTVGVTFLEDGKVAGEQAKTYRARYCMDESFIRAVEKSVPADNPFGSPYAENRIAYILTTGANWAGPIADFRLTIDKGKPENLVSLCAEGLQKTGPTTFEMRRTDFYPDDDLDLLILTRMGE